jgi:hypothetical protein
MLSVSVKSKMQKSSVCTLIKKVLSSASGAQAAPVWFAFSEVPSFHKSGLGFTFHAPCFLQV